MKRSTLTFSFALAALFALGAADGCSSSGGGGNDGGGGTGPGGGSGGSAGGTTGSGGTTGGGGIGGTGATAGRGGAAGGATGGDGCGGLGGTQGLEGDPCTSNGCLPGLSCVSCICVSAGGRGGGTAGSTGGGGGIAGNGGNGNGGRGGNGGNGGNGNGGRGGNGGNGNGGRGGGTGGNGGTGGTGGIAATMTLTSTALTEGGMFAADNTCAGTNVSPPLNWTAGPSATMSYGIALVDMTNGFVHWTIWDMPPTTMSLPAMLPTTQTLTTPVMAKQINRFQGDGYSGPCPMGSEHRYIFEVYALDVATLPSVNLSGMPEMVRTQMMAHDLAMGTLSGTSNASP